MSYGSKLKQNKFGIWCANFYNPEKGRGDKWNSHSKDEKVAYKMWEKWKAGKILGLKTEERDFNFERPVFFSEAFGLFKNRLKNTKRKAKTIRAYETAAHFLIRYYGDKPPKSYGIIDPSVKLQEHSVNTCANYSKHLRIIFDYFLERADKFDNIKSNPVELTDFDFKEPEAIPIDVKEIIFNRLKEIDKKFYLCSKLALLCAYRREELMNVSGKDFLFEQGVFKVVNLKGSRKGEIRVDTLPMLSDIEDFLHEYYVEGKFFNYTSGERIGKMWAAYIKQMVEEGLIPKAYTFHQLRKTRATELRVKYRMSKSDVQFFMRHLDYKTTDEHYVDEPDKDVLEAQERLARMNRKLNPVQIFKIAETA